MAIDQSLAAALDPNTIARAQREFLLSNPRQQPQSATDSMTEATLTGADVAGQQYAQQKQAQQQAVMDNVTRRLAQGLLGAKGAYEQGQALFGNAENEEQAAAGQLLMDKAAQQAQTIRQSANAAGLDLSRFGENITYQQAAQTMQDDTLRGLANLFSRNDMTSDEYYDQQYQQLRAKHYTERQARDEAARRAGRFQAERMGRLSNAFHNYGLGENGAINSDGVRILNMMAGEDEKAANIFAQMYANPKSEYTAQAAREAANLDFQRKLALNDRRAQQQADLAAYRAALRGSGGGGGGNSMSRNAMLQQLANEEYERTGDWEHAREYAHEEYNRISSAGKSSRSKNTNGDYDKKTDEELNKLKVELEKAQKLVHQGAQFDKHSEQRKKAIDESGDILSPLQERINIIAANISPEDLEALQVYKDNIEKSRNRSLLDLTNWENIDYFGEE